VWCVCVRLSVCLLQKTSVRLNLFEFILHAHDGERVEAFASTFGIARFEPRRRREILQIIQKSGCTKRGPPPPPWVRRRRRRHHHHDFRHEDERRRRAALRRRLARMGVLARLRDDSQNPENATDVRQNDGDAPRGAHGGSKRRRARRRSPQLDVERPLNHKLTVRSVPRERERDVPIRS